MDLSNGSFSCLCPLGWKNKHCETLVDFCANVTCLNKGACRTSLRNYTCECLGDSYSGRHCEVVASAIGVHQAIARSLAFVAIIALGTVVTFIVLMDVLRYGFGIDPAPSLIHRRRRRVNREKTRSRVVTRLIYVNASPTPPF